MPKSNLSKLKQTKVWFVIFFFISLSPCFLCSGSWTNLTRSPLARNGAAMAYDGSHVVLFGGDSPAAELGDTWIWDGDSQNWQEIEPVSPTPSARAHASMANDGSRVVLFGGKYINTYLSDTWLWNGVSQTWQELNPLVPSPPARSGASMSYDGSHIVLFGGQNSSDYLSDTWIWNGVTQTWHEVFPSSNPSKRSNASVAYDGTNVVLFGGEDSSQTFRDTWLWNGSQWNEVDSLSSRPSARAFATMAYDGEQTILFGGLSDAVENDTWLWNGSNHTWQEATSLTNVPTARSDAMGAFDGNEVVLFGGVNDSGILGDTWLWDGLSESWENATYLTPAPSPRYDHSSAYDGKKTLLFGGADVNDEALDETWLWDGIAQTWQKVNSLSQKPPARISASMAYDGSKIVLFGGKENSSDYLSDTWLWDGNTKTWQEVVTTSNPSKRWGASMAYDGIHAVLFGGQDQSHAVLNDTWIWDGSNWNLIEPLARPSVRTFATMAYDGVHVLLFGGMDAAFHQLGDTWLWDGSSQTWQEITSLSSIPDARWSAMSAYDGTNVILFGGYNPTVGYFGDTWLWDASSQTWQEVSPLSPSPFNRDQASMTYDGSGAVLFGGESESSDLSDTWRWKGVSALFPPTFKSKKIVHRLKGYVYRFRWKASPSPSVTEYLVYRGKKQIDRVFADEKLLSKDGIYKVNRKKKYKIFAQDDVGNRSNPLKIQFPEEVVEQPSCGAYGYLHQ